MTGQLGHLIEEYLARQTGAKLAFARPVLHDFLSVAGPLRQPRTLTPQDVERWLGPKPVKRKTKRVYAAVLRAFVRWLVATGRAAPGLEDFVTLARPQPMRRPEDRGAFFDLVDIYGADRVRRGLHRPRTATNVELSLRRFVRTVGRSSPRQVTPADIERWAASLEVAPATLRTEASRVRAFFAWLVKTERIKGDPTAGFEMPRAPRALPRNMARDAVHALVEQLDVRGQLVISLMVQEGLRCGEVTRLEVGDIDFAERALLVRGKGGHERLLPITDETWSCLRRHLDEFGVVGGPIIQSRVKPGRPIGAAYLSNLVAEWMADAGIKRLPHDGVSAHALRHTCATDMLKQGAQVREVQAAMGHQLLSTTQRYLGHVQHRDLRAAMGGRSYR